MTEDEFWGIIDQARRDGGDRIRALAKHLAKRSRTDLEAFQRHYDEALVRAYRWDLWGAAYLMNGGCSDDSFRYFRDWLISEGRDVFARALRDPDSLAQLPKAEYFELEEFGYVALEAYQSQGGGELERDFSTEGAEPEGEEWTEADLPALFPRLAAKYT